MACLASFMAIGLFPAISAARARVVSMSFSAGTHSSTTPRRYSSAPDKRWPVNIKPPGFRVREQPHGMSSTAQQANVDFWEPQHGLFRGNEEVTRRHNG